ncbi:MAG: selenocysteine-specific translation elongation factor, partial [Syntrophales bacterium]|nr:selenocysteine-specific translation elongation factor [Syntrophales bacterium]
MKHIVLGTAGHVDHGKTSLVKALTDVDTDRLKEEKERGITIDLGFAPLKLDEDTFAGIVDVPGHERFVKNMVAGAAGIDMVALVIAADEGVMPQTREHLHVCDLLNVRRGLVAVTKTDLVDEEWLSLVIEDIRIFLEGSFLEGAPIIPVSSHSGSGLSDFVDTLRRIVSEESTGKRPDFFRLPVDRIFTMKGFGTVVTGTLVGGKVTVGDTVTILPSGIATKVRGLQVHNESRVFAEPGFRTAINFQGLGKEAIRRGDIIAHPDIFEPSQRMDILLRHLPGAKRKLKHRAPVRFHAGTAEIMARLYFPDREDLEPGEETYAQVILEEPTAAMAGDHFVIRSYSPVTTIGGGRILDPLARKVKRFSSTSGQAVHPGIGEMKRLHTGSSIEKTETILRRAGLEGISLNRLAIRTGIPLAEQQNLMEEMLSRKKALLADKEDRRAIAWETYEDLTKKMLDIINRYHERYPLKKGLAKEELRISLGTRIPQKLFHKALMDLETDGLVSLDREMVARAGYDVRLGEGLEELKESIMRRYKEA